jgi:prepilin peptidase CpaA
MIGNLSLVWWLLLATISILICYSDIRYRKIPNEYCLMVLVLSLILWVSSERDWGTITISLIFLIGGFFLFIIGVWGAGDAKLIASFSPLFDPSLLPLGFFITASTGVTIGAIQIAISYLFGNNEKHRGVPYAVAICVGSLFTALASF